MRRLVGIVLAAAAWAGGPVKGEHVVAELVAEHASAQPGTAVVVGVHLRLDPGWHVYWRNPGDSGQAPAVRWTLPQGVTAGPPRWPAPERIPAGPFMTYGYSGELLLPVELRVPADFAADTLDVRANVTWLVCEKVCIGGEAGLDLSLPVRAGAPEAAPRRAELFARTRARLPREPAEGALAAVPGDDGDVVLRVEGVSAKETLSFFPDGDGLIRHAAPQPVARARGGAEITLERDKEREEPIDRLVGVLVLGRGEGARALVVDVPVAAADTATMPSFLLILLLVAGVGLVFLFLRKRA